jgi:cell wall-associated NlpC family hydrolase
MSPRRILGALALVACIGVVLLVVQRESTRSEQHRSARSNGGASSPNAIQDAEAAQSFPEPASGKSHKLAKSPAEAVAQAPASGSTGVSPGAPSDAEVRRELRQLERYKRRARSSSSIESGPRGLAHAPTGAPAPITDAIAGGNAIATFPYRLGGGHGSFVDSAYDCSGSVSYALGAAGLVEAPLTSGQFMKWGAPGPGRWLTVYANPGHIFMTVGGLRFDTSGRAGLRGSRWQPAQRSARGFAVRHWPGL